MTTFRAASEVWMDKIEELVGDGRRSPATVDTYKRQLKNHVLPAMAEVRLGEITTPLVDKVVGKIKREVRNRIPWETVAKEEGQTL